jgi:adenosine deaminase
LTIELHRHFEAGIRPGLMARLAAKHGITDVRTRAGNVVPGVDPQDPDQIRRYYRDIAAGFVTPGGFARFVDSFGLPLSVLRSLEDLELTVYDQLLDCADAGSLHTELRGSPFSYQEHLKAPIEDIADALLRGVDRAWMERGASGTFILAFSRQKGLGDESAPPVQRQAPLIAVLAARLHTADRPVGLDIAGFPEVPFPPRLFEAALAPAREAGVPLTVHAGEQGLPPSFADAPPALIIDAVERLGAKRIGHGTSLVASAEARALMKARGIGIECCPVSNHRMGFIRIADHPLKQLLEEGLLVSVSTDDPLMFGPFSVQQTFDAIEAPLALGPDDLVTLTRNAIETAFVSDARRAHLRTLLRGRGGLSTER